MVRHTFVIVVIVRMRRSDSMKYEGEPHPGKSPVIEGGTAIIVA
jgi:hypothetical protein